jgi:hypothetical protein
MSHVVKTSYAAFPPEGIDVHISAEHVSKRGIKPGDLVVIEIIVRPSKDEVWIAEGVNRVFESDEEEDEFFERAPDPARVANRHTCFRPGSTSGG